MPFIALSDRLSLKKAGKLRTIPERIFDTIFTEPIGELVIRELPLKLIIIDEEKAEVSQWIPPYKTGKL